MCGIGGILRRESGNSTELAAEKLLRALEHRGPDDRGIFRASHEAISLVHARLAILDRRMAGHQPMTRHGCTITFNGEIYNFPELREDLERRGEHFQSESDTEVLLILYAREGPKCLSRLRGMFAFAIWDEREGICFMARDRFGIKPLYYASDRNGNLVFASEMKALFAADLFERQLDPAGLDSFLATGSVAEPRTMCLGVRCLEAGCWMRWRDGALEMRRYFQIDLDPVETSFAEARERTRAALLDSVRHHFVSDVPVGIFLSGGLDSGALVALARETGQRDLGTFSIAVEDSPRDESNAARSRAELFGTEHREMLLTRELAQHWVEAFLLALDQPTVDGFNIYCVSKLAADHGYKVVLSGLGGDELFGGYPSFRRAPELLKIGRAVWPFRGVTVPLARARERRTRSGRSARMAGFLQGEASLSRAYETVRSIFSPRERDQIGRAVMGEAWGPEDGAENGSAENPGNDCGGVSGLEITRYLRNQLLRDADVMSMAHGLELRVPFLDHELWRVLRRIPDTIRLRAGKELLRAAIPELPGGKAKRGFTLPFGEWLDGAWIDLKENLRGAPAVPLDSWSRKWSLIVLNRWLRRHGFTGWAK